MSKTLDELLQNEETVVALVEAETPDAFCAILNENGIELDGVTKEEAFEAFHSQKDAGTVSDELNADALDNVAGGVVACTVAIIGSTAICVSAGAWAYGVYRTFYKKKRR